MALAYLQSKGISNGIKLCLLIILGDIHPTTIFIEKKANLEFKIFDRDLLSGFASTFKAVFDAN